MIQYIFINYIRLFELTELYQTTYNPNKYYFVKSSSIKRDCDDRIMAIQKNMDFSQVNSYLDIGSQLGYFVFKLGELYQLKLAQGIEMNEISCAYANAIVYLNNLKNISFMNCKISQENVMFLPDYDVISFLNVYHHVVYFEGFSCADKIMRELYNKCNKYFIFETGQFDEKGYYWSECLSFMGENPSFWLQNYLVDIGYKEVLLVNEFPTHLSDKKRCFFICSK